MPRLSAWVRAGRWWLASRLAGADLAALRADRDYWRGDAYAGWGRVRNRDAAIQVKDVRYAELEASYVAERDARAKDVAEIKRLREALAKALGDAEEARDEADLARSEAKLVGGRLGNATGEIAELRRERDAHRAELAALRRCVAEVRAVLDRPTTVPVDPGVPALPVRGVYPADPVGWADPDTQD